jgi:hypothetical protein
MSSSQQVCIWKVSFICVGNILSVPETVFYLENENINNIHLYGCLGGLSEVPDEDMSSVRRHES